MSKISKGFTCECGKFHEFGVYVAAHADIELTHTCTDCQAQHGVKDYHVWLKKKGTFQAQSTDRKEATG